MAMEILRANVQKEAEAELQRAIAKWGLMASRNEGYAVILEEFEETRDALNDLEGEINILWDAVKENAPFGTIDIYYQAVDVACEAIQTAAMALKMGLSFGGPDVLEIKNRLERKDGGQDEHGSNESGIGSDGNS